MYKSLRSSEMWGRVVWYINTNVSEEPITFILNVEDTLVGVTGSSETEPDYMPPHPVKP
jgi:hypothetical protein